MSWMTAIGEGLKLFNSWFLSSKRKAKSLESEKQKAFNEAKELAYGDDEKALEKHIESLPE